MVNPGEQLSTGINGYTRSFNLIDRNRLWSFLVLPSIICLLIAILVGILAWMTSEDFVLYLIERHSFRDYGSRVGSLVELTISFIIWGFTFFVYLKVYRYLTLILLSPVFVNISRELEKKLNGREEKMNIWSYCFSSYRGIKLALRNFMLEILIYIFLFFIMLILVWIIPLIPAIILLIESYLYGMVMMDYGYEMKGYSLKESRRLTRENAGIAVGNGLIFNLILLFPLIGVMIGPVWALIAARVSIDEQESAEFYVNPIHKPI